MLVTQTQNRMVMIVCPHWKIYILNNRKHLFNSKLPSIMIKLFISNHSQFVFGFESYYIAQADLRFTI